MVILVFSKTATNTSQLSLVLRASQLIWSRFSPNALSPIPQSSFVPPMISVNSPEAPIYPLLHKKRSKKNSNRPLKTLSCISQIPASKLGCSRSLPYAGAWLTAVTMKGLGLYLLTAEFQAAVKYRIGLPLFASARRCPVCPSGNLDVLGDDVFACGRNRGRISGHGRRRDVKFERYHSCPSCSLQRATESNSWRAVQNRRHFCSYLECCSLNCFWRHRDSPVAVLSHAAETPGATHEILRTEILRGPRNHFLAVCSRNARGLVRRGHQNSKWSLFSLTLGVLVPWTRVFLQCASSKASPCASWEKTPLW